ncbi:UDP-N-acetylmuramate dehydrogenase [Streptomyces sp. 4F14]|uniref:UDP-N-acetylmuramate dehydrogenase n=1 Tax=Streptomyces sp. 4F14 TaxID=3394380 RepID=UPI003A862DC9
MGELLADHTTLRLGGPADQFLTHTDPATWPDLARSVPGTKVPFVLGGGSNTLADDAGYPGTVIRMATRGITQHPLDDGLVEVIVQAGEPLAEVVEFTAAQGLSGIEYLGGIPGTIGAAPVQNTGAYGQQISDTLSRITAYDWQLRRTVELRPDNCDFGYRTSAFKNSPGRWTILAIALRLIRSPLASPVSYPHLADALAVPLGARPPLAEAAQAVLADRHHRGLTLPAEGPDCRQAGSVFLNPAVTPAQATAIHHAGGPVHRTSDGSLRASAGWLLEQAGFHPGRRIGTGVYCSDSRTLTLAARESATAASFAHALRVLADAVVATHSIRLRPEPGGMLKT